MSYPLYVIVALLWIALAITIATRVPRCSSMSSPWKVFIVLILVMYIFSTTRTLIRVLSANRRHQKRMVQHIQHVERFSNGGDDGSRKKQRIDIGLITAMAIVYMILWIILAVWYFSAVQVMRCDNDIISPVLFWSFVVVTIAHMLLSITVPDPSAHMFKITQSTVARTHDLCILRDDHHLPQKNELVS